MKFSLLDFQDYSAREWVKQGAPKEKLMIGMPTYGRSFTLVDKDKFDIGAPASGGGVAGNFTNESGFLSYYEVLLFYNTLKRANFRRHLFKILISIIKLTINIRERRKL